MVSVNTILMIVCCFRNEWVEERKSPSSAAAARSRVHARVLRATVVVLPVGPGST